jgi:FMN phosphatase YigB (HAD superfamily)
MNSPVEQVLEVFDPDFYTRRYGTPGGSLSPIDHYRQFGWQQGLDPSPLFDVSWYLEEHPDVRAKQVDPLEFYLTTGWRRGDDPTPWFDSAWYTAVNSDVAGSAVSPLVHYLRIGLPDGRAVNATHFNSLTTVPIRVSAEKPPQRLSPAAVLHEPGGPEVRIPVDAIEHLDADLVTFDLWDTLIKRTRPADAAKVASARRLWLELGSPRWNVWELFEARVDAERELAVGAHDEEYEIHRVVERWLDLLGIEAQNRVALVTSLVDAEITDEIAGTVPVAAMATVVARLRAQQLPGRSLAVLSDFYIGADGLSKLLDHHGLNLHPDDIHVSCELGASKRLGTAFGAVEALYGVEPDRHVHIGDHPIADAQRALENGTRAVLFQHDEFDSHPAPGSLTRGWYTGAVRSLEGDLMQLARVRNFAFSSTTAEQRAFAAGVISSVLSVAHVAGVIEQAAQVGVEKVYYVSREGSFLRRVHEAVGSIITGGDAPQPRHLEVSRRSTFGPSLRTLDPSDLMRMWRQYSNQSPRGFLVSLGLDADDYADDLRRFGLGIEEVLVDVSRNERLGEFLADRTVSKRVMDSLDQNRALLAAYLEDRGVGDAPTVVADIGWRGTIQDNLCHVLPDVEFHGVYLGLFPYLNPQPANSSKRAVVFDGNLGDVFGHVSPPAAVEAAWTPSIPTVHGYQRLADGRVLPEGPLEPHRADGLIAAFQAGALDSAPTVARWMVSVGATTELIRSGLQDVLRRYYSCPLPGVCDIWFESAHDDTFGVLNETPYAKSRVSRDFLDLPHGAEAHPAAVSSLWPAGYASWLPVQAATLVAQYRAEASS